MESVVLNSVSILGMFCSKQGQGFTTSSPGLFPSFFKGKALGTRLRVLSPQGPTYTQILVKYPLRGSPF